MVRIVSEWIARRPVVKCRLPDQRECRKPTRSALAKGGESPASFDVGRDVISTCARRHANLRTKALSATTDEAESKDFCDTILLCRTSNKRQ